MKIDPTRYAMFTLALRELSPNPANHLLRNIGRGGGNIPWENRQGIDDVCRRFGDTNSETTAIGYIKVLESLGFEQFADFKMPNQGRTLAFARLSGLVLAMLNIRKGHAPHLTCTLRRGIVRGRQFFDPGFAATITPMGVPSRVAFQITFVGNTGLSYRMHCMDRSINYVDRWWSLDETGTSVLPVSSDNYLMTDLDRKQCSGYTEMVEMQEERRRAVDGYHAAVLDTGHTRRYLDVCETVSREQGSLQ